MHGVTLNDLIKAALSQRRYNQQRLGFQAMRYCRAITNRFCADFPEDLHEEVLGQAFAELMAAGPDALTDRSGLSVFRQAIFKSIRIVRADYAPPGRRTRRTLADLLPEKVAAEHIGRLADSQAIERCTVGDPGNRHLDFDLLESPAAAEAVKQCEDLIDSEWYLRRAPADLATALRLIYLNDEPVSVAAEIVGLSRFTLHRQTSAFAATWRAAA